MNPSPDFYEAAIKLFGSLGLILIVVLGASFGMKRLAQNEFIGKKDKLIKIMASQYLGGKKSIVMLKAAEVVLIVGVTSNQINLLARLGKEDIADLSSPDDTSELASSRFSAFFNRAVKSTKDRLRT